MQHLKVAIKVLLLGFFSILIVLIIAAVFVEYILPKFLEAKYKNQITNSYDAAFPPLDPYLEKMGITLPPVEEVACDNGPYSPSSPCGKWRFTDKVKFDKSSAEKWLKTSQQLDTYLSTHGWQFEKEFNNTTFTKLVTSTNNYQTYATYTKESHGVHCDISAEHLTDGPYGGIRLVEGCSKFTLSPRAWLRSHNIYLPQ